jgi:hypothetical protein
MKASTLTMTVSATEPIAGTFPIELEGPGLYLLSGPPEAGKSNVLDSLLFAYLKASGGNPKAERYRVSVSFEAREKAPEAFGQITLPGFKGPAGIRVYESQIRKLPAPPTVQILDGTPFTLLTRSGLDEPKARQAAELRAFATITQVGAIASQLVPEGMAADVEGIQSGLLPDVAASVGKRLHALKGRMLDDAAAVERKLTACRAQADKEASEAVVGTVAEEQAALTLAEEQAAEIRLARRGRERVEQQVAQWRALQPAERPDEAEAQQRLDDARKGLAQTLEQASAGLPPAPDIRSAQNTVHAAGVAMAACEQRCTDTQTEIVRLELQLAALRAQAERYAAEREASAQALHAAQEALEETKTAHAEWLRRKMVHDHRKARMVEQQREVDGLEQQVRAIAEQQRQWDERQAMLERPIDGPEQADVDSALVAVTAQRGKLALAERRDREVARQAEDAELRQKLEHMLGQAEAYRVAATTGVKTRVGDVLAGHKIDGWSIEDGILLCHSPRAGKQIPFSDLSRSTQDVAALKLYIQHMFTDPECQYHLILLPQEAMDGTTDEQRRAIAEIAAASGRYVLSAMVSEQKDLKVIKV